MTAQELRKIAEKALLEKGAYPEIMEKAQKAAENGNLEMHWYNFIPSNVISELRQNSLVVVDISERNETIYKISW